MLESPYHDKRMKITDIKVVRFRTKHYKDALGNRFRDKEKYLAKRPVKNIGTGPRFGHYCLDTLCFRLIVTALSYGAAFILSIIKLDLLASLSAQLGFVLVFFLIWPLMYFFFEYNFQRTPGKFLTRCRVINEYGEKPSLEQVIQRSLFRLVPFEPFSCLGDDSRGWHDKWSNTWVVTDKELAELKRLMEEQSNPKASQANKV